MSAKKAKGSRKAAEENNPNEKFLVECYCDFVNGGKKYQGTMFVGKTYFDFKYRERTAGSVHISLFDSLKDAQKAIHKEEAMLRKEAVSATRDIKTLQKSGISKRYPGISFVIMKSTNALAVNTHKFKIVRIKDYPTFLQYLKGEK